MRMAATQLGSHCTIAQQVTCAAVHTSMRVRGRCRWRWGGDGVGVDGCTVRHVAVQRFSLCSLIIYSSLRLQRCRVLPRSQAPPSSPTGVRRLLARCRASAPPPPPPPPRLLPPPLPFCFLLLPRCLRASHALTPPRQPGRRRHRRHPSPPQRSRRAARDRAESGTELSWRREIAATAAKQRRLPVVAGACPLRPPRGIRCCGAGAGYSSSSSSLHCCGPPR